MPADVLVKYLVSFDVKLFPVGIVKYFAYTKSEMKFATCRRAYFTWRQPYFTAKRFHLPVRANFTEKATSCGLSLFHGAPGAIT